MCERGDKERKGKIRKEWEREKEGEGGSGRETWNWWNERRMRYSGSKP